MDCWSQFVFVIKDEIGLFIISYYLPLTGAIIAHSGIKVTNLCAELISPGGVRRLLGNFQEGPLCIS